MCPKCGSKMILRTTSKFTYGDGSPRKFYGCCRYPTCTGTHCAHPDGKPVGIPADDELKKLRMRAHKLFDNFMQGMTKGQAYVKLSKMMDIDIRDCHFGMMNFIRAKRAIKLMSEYVVSREVINGKAN